MSPSPRLPLLTSRSSKPFQSITRFASLKEMTTLGEEKSGKKETSVSSILKLQHLQKLAKCAGVPPPLAALFGHHLASNAEAAGVPLDSSWFLCQRSDLSFIFVFLLSILMIEQKIIFFSSILFYKNWMLF